LAAVWKTGASVGEYQIGRQSISEITSFARIPFAVSLNKARLSGPMWRHYGRSLECEHSLTEVIGYMVGAAQQGGEAIA